jgi:hypothetical protein
MRMPRVALAAFLAALSAPARAQTGTHAISVESGISAPLGPGPGAHAPLAVAAAFWLEGDVDVVARVAFGAARETTDRGTAGWISGTAGLRWSLAPGPLRPQLFAEGGWARLDGPGGAPRGGLALGAGGALEWFPVRDVALAAACALRRGPAGLGWRAEATAGLSAYF